MSEIIDRVATAIFDDYDWSFVPQGGFAEQELHVQEIFRNLAKAAIKAMREPTEAMCDAADWQQQSEVNQYQRAIDAALVDQ